MATMGLNLTVGYAGQMSLGQAAFLGIGAYIDRADDQGRRVRSALLPLRPASPASRSASRSAFRRLRVQHHYLAFVTLGFNVLVWLVIRNEEWITGGIFGISDIPRPTLFGFSLRPARLFLLVRRWWSRPSLAFWPVVAAALALGARVHRAARQPDPRRKPRRQYAPLYAARFRDRRGLCAALPARSMRRWSSSSTRRRSTFERRS